jgi:hypothetical protein
MLFCQNFVFTSWFKGSFFPIFIALLNDFWSFKGLGFDMINLVTSLVHSLFEFSNFFQVRKGATGIALFLQR